MGFLLLPEWVFRPYPNPYYTKKRPHLHDLLAPISLGRCLLVFAMPQPPPKGA